MICPACKTENIKVLESRDTDWWLALRRRRQCNECAYRFTTFERIETTNLLVIKKNWSRENYDRKKLEMWVLNACRKRLVTSEQIESFFNALESKWITYWKEISSQVIWDDVMNALKDLDEVAYIRFVSVFRNLDARAIKEELSNFLHDKSK